MGGGGMEELYSGEHPAWERHISQVVPSESTAETIHLPRLIIPGACIEKCGKLATKAAEALLENARNPDWQNDVVCSGKTRLGCNGHRVRIGSYSTFGAKVGDSGELFLVDPARYEPTSASPIQLINEATKNGATVHRVDDLK